MYEIIFNPGSRSNRSILVWNTVRNLLDEKNIEYLLYQTAYAGHAEELAKDITSDNQPHTFIVIGGDGTINEVLNGIQNPELVTIGLIPSGSGNDFAKALNISLNPEVALENILDCEKTTPINFGEIHIQNIRRRFLISCGCGFDSDVCVGVQKSSLKPFLNKLGMGKLIYTLIAFKKLITKSTFSATIQLDNDYVVSMNNIFFLIAMNTKYEGGGYMFCPDADPSDDKIDFLTANNISRCKMLRLLPKAKRGTHAGHKGITITPASKISLKLSKPVHIHADGEVYGKYDYLSIACSKEHLNFML